MGLSAFKQRYRRWCFFFVFFRLEVPEVSQYMQNFFNFNTLLFSFFVSQTYASLHAQQESHVKL